MSAIIVDMHQEMYIDALHFFRRARENRDANGDAFETWRNLRAALLFSFTAIETCINGFISTLPKGRQQQLRNIVSKLTIGMELLDERGLDSHDRLWKDFLEFKNLRNDLAHYTSEKYKTFYSDEFFEKTDKGITTAREVIITLYEEHPSKTGHPKAFDELP